MGDRNARSRSAAARSYRNSRGRILNSTPGDFAKGAATRRDLLIGVGAAIGAAAAGGAEAEGGSSSLPACEWDYRSAGELATALRARRVSSVELVDRAIARIEALDGGVNAVVVRDFDRARAAARAADDALARGETGPLLGVPATVKESFNVAGLPTTWGDPRFKSNRPSEDALAVARLKKAGAVVLGKTNVSRWLSDWQSYNSVYGTTRNPWDRRLTPGGSSGGSAAALAAGFGAISLGSDMGGSLRGPAHYCGVYAHKPTLGLAPRRGQTPPGGRALPDAHDLAVVGPMARSALDLQSVLDSIAGPDEADFGVGYRLALPPARHDRLSDYRVLVIVTHPLVPTAGAVRAALDSLAEELARAGAKVARTTPLLPDLAESARLYMRLLSAHWGANLPFALYNRLIAAADALSSRDRSLAAERARGATLSFREWRLANAEREELRQKWRDFFRDWDVVICPAAPTPAFPHDHSEPIEARRLRIDGRRYPYLDAQLIWADVATTAGLPATVAPIGRTQDGLPIGAQIVGPFLEDRTTLAFATLIERAFGGFAPPRM